MDLNENLHRQVYEARVSDEVRFYMVNAEVFTFEQHLKFVETLKNQNDRIYWAACMDNTFLVAVNFHPLNQNENWGEWGIFVNPIYMGQGIAKYVGKIFMEQVAQKMSIEIVKAKVKVNNLRSIQFHRRIGFEMVGNDEAYLYMENKLQKQRFDGLTELELGKNVVLL